MGQSQPTRRALKEVFFFFRSLGILMGPPTSTNTSLPPPFELLPPPHLSLQVWGLHSSSNNCYSLGARPWGRERDCVPLRGWSAGSARFVGSSFFFGPLKIPDSSATSDLDSLWLQRVAVGSQAFESSKSLLRTVHVARVGCVPGLCACKFLPSHLGDPAVAGKAGARRQGTGGRGNWRLRGSFVT